jgi:putative membrane protein
MRKHTIAVAVATVFGLSAPLWAAQKPATPKARSSSQPKTATASQASDQRFIKEAGEGGLAEVELGKLATEKASNPEVKKFGQRMVDDHSKANDELKSLAQQKNVTVPGELGAKDKAAKDRLSKLSGAAFDRRYMALMVSDHSKDVSEFRQESQRGKDDDVKAFASKTLPTLEDHLKMARDIASKTGAVATKGKKN